MHDLNKQQVVLLCLLVSFVTSVATGITVVSLLDQSPQPVTQTINRVVERTVEKVIDQAEDAGLVEQRPVERVVETVVVNQEDLTVDAVDKNAPRFVRIYGHDRFGNRKFAGVGVVANAQGAIVTDDSVALLYNTFEADYAEGTHQVALKGGVLQGTIAVFLPTDAADKTFGAIAFGDSQSLKLAQSVIVLSGTTANTVATGIITGLTTAAGAVSTDASSVPTEALTQIATNIDPASVTAGSMLMTLKGDVVGFKVGSATGATFMPANAVKAVVAAP
ncbi:MAG: hypothetical protein RL150_34 [Candidatus Parcubacteria bacterium]|jgi:S1-C subfamily serine protease